MHKKIYLYEHTTNQKGAVLLRKKKRAAGYITDAPLENTLGAP